MSGQRKPWLDDKGQLLKGIKLHKAKKNWKADDWDEYLKKSVEKPLRELPVGGDHELALLSDKGNKGYADLLEIKERRFFSSKIEQGMKRLTEREREILFALFWEGLSQRKLAEKLKIARPTVVVYQKRALEKLGRYLLNSERETEI